MRVRERQRERNDDDDDATTAVRLQTNTKSTKIRLLFPMTRRVLCVLCADLGEKTEAPRSQKKAHTHTHARTSIK